MRNRYFSQPVVDFDVGGKNGTRGKTVGHFNDFIPPVTFIDFNDIFRIDIWSYRVRTQEHVVVIFDAWIVVCSVKNIGIILIFGEKRMDFCNIHYCRNFTDFLEGYALVSEMMLGVGVIRGCSRYDGKVALIIHKQIDRVIGGCVVVFNMYVFTKMIEVKLGEGIAAI